MPLERELKLRVEYPITLFFQGWQRHDLTREGDPYPIIFYLRDPLAALKDLLSTRSNATGFVYSPCYEYNSSGQRVVSTPKTTHWWHNMQVSLLSITWCLVSCNSFTYTS
jgi:hypothetical protein